MTEDTKNREKFKTTICGVNRSNIESNINYVELERDEEEKLMQKIN